MMKSFFTTMTLVRVLSSPSERSAYVLGSWDRIAMKSTFKPKIIEIPEKLMTYASGVGVMKNNFIFPMTDRTVGRLLENGIPQYFLKYLDEVDFHPTTPDDAETGPKVFELDDLSFGFYVILASCGISFLVFLVELLYFYGQIALGLLTLLRALTNRNVFPCGELRY